MVLMMIGLLWPTNASSESIRGYEYEWKKGDTVKVAIACPEEEDILKIVKADTESEEEVLAKMYSTTNAPTFLCSGCLCRIQRLCR